MKKKHYLLFIILLPFLFIGCNNDKVESLEYRVAALEQEVSELKNELEANAQFEKEMQCQEMLDRLKKRWNNIVGCYYSSYYNTCMVKYKKNGKIMEAGIEDMSDSDQLLNSLTNKCNFYQEKTLYNNVYKKQAKH